MRQHSPIAVADDSEPEPDVAVVPLGGSRLDVARLAASGATLRLAAFADVALSLDEILG